MADEPYVAGAIERFTREAGHGVVHLDDGRALPFDAGACRSYLGDGGFFPAPGAKVHVRVGVGRSGAARASEVRDGTPPPGSGPTIGDALAALVDAGLLDAAARAQVDPFLLPIHADLHHRGVTGRDLLLGVLARLADAAGDAVPGLVAGVRVGDVGALARGAGLAVPAVQRRRLAARGFEEAIALVASSTGALPVFTPLDAPRAVNALLAACDDPRRFVHLVARDAPSWARAASAPLVWLLDASARARVHERVGAPFALELAPLAPPVPLAGDGSVVDAVVAQVRRGAIDWASVAHCYGPATDAPAQLARLRAPDEDEHGDALVGWVYGALSHQGDVFPATAAALPALVALVEDPATPDRAGVASAVARIALDARRHAEGTADLKHPACSVLRVLAHLRPRLVALAVAAAAPLDGYALVALATLSAEVPAAGVVDALGGASSPKARLAKRLARSVAAIEKHLATLDGDDA